MYFDKFSQFKFAVYETLSKYSDLISVRNCFACKKNKSLDSNRFFCAYCYKQLQQEFYKQKKFLDFSLEDIENFAGDLVQPSIYKVFRYDSLVQKLMRDFKYRKPHYKYFWVQELLKFWNAYADWLLADLDPEVFSRYGEIESAVNLGLRINISSMPVHLSKLKSRQYNQSALLAESFSQNLQIGSRYLLQSSQGLAYHELVEINLINALFVRIKNTPSLYDKNKIERLEIMNKAFAIDENFLPDSNLLNVLVVIDDICTTGSSFLAMHKLIKNYEIFESLVYIALCGG